MCLKVFINLESRLDLELKLVHRTRGERSSVLLMRNIQSSECTDNSPALRPGACTAGTATEVSGTAVPNKD